MRFWGKFSRTESAGSFLQLSLKNIFSQGRYTKGENRKERWESAILLCCDVFLYLPKSLWKSSWEPCTGRWFTSLNWLGAHANCTVALMFFFICCIASREAKGTLCMQVQWLPACEEQWILLFLLAGEQGEQYRGFCSPLASPPRVPLRVHERVAKAFSALSFHSMLETTHKATHLSKFGNKHAEAYPVCTVRCRLQYWNDGTWDKEAMVRKRDRPPPKKPFSHRKESISFPLSKALERLKWVRRRSYVVTPGLHLCWPRAGSDHKLPQSLWEWAGPFKVLSNPNHSVMRMMLISWTQTQSVMIRQWVQFLAIPEAIYNHGRRTELRFLQDTISWDSSNSLTTDLLLLLSTFVLSQVLMWILQDYCSRAWV